MKSLMDKAHIFLAINLGMLGIFILVNGRVASRMVMGHILSLMVVSGKVYGLSLIHI